MRWSRPGDGLVPSQLEDVHSSESIGEAEPADKGLVGASFGPQASADRPAVEVQVEIQAEHATVVVGCAEVHIQRR